MDRNEHSPVSKLQCTDKQSLRLQPHALWKLWRKLLLGLHEAEDKLQSV